MLILCTLTRDCRARCGALVLAVVTAIVPVSLLASQAPVPAREASVQVQERDENAERMRAEMEAMMHTLREIERNMAVHGIGLEWRLTSLADVRHRTIDATETARQLLVLREALESLQKLGMERRGDRVPEPPVDPPDRR